MDTTTRAQVKLTAQRIRFLLPISWQKSRLAELLDAEPRMLECDSVQDGRTLALLGCLDDVQEALSEPRQVPPKNRVVVHGPVRTVMLALLDSLAGKLNGDPSMVARRRPRKDPRPAM